MSTPPINLTVLPAGPPLRTARSLPLSLLLPENTTVLELKRAIAAKFPQLRPERQRLTLDGDGQGEDKEKGKGKGKGKGKKQPLEDEQTLASLGLDAGGEGVVRVKDLGPQIGWKTVYVIEYLGPLLIHPLFYHGKDLIYRFALPYDHSLLQRTTYALVMLHFLKRELETLYLHRFSRSTMPFNFVFRNSAHYWLLSGALVALVVYSPSYGQQALEKAGDVALRPEWVGGWVTLWVFAQLSNLHSHYTVASLRPPGTRSRGIPRGYGFDLVSFPNYLFEILAWLAVLGLTRSWAVAAFILVGGTTMVIWAKQKHRAYKKEFGDKYPRNRKAIIPFIY